MLDRKILSKKPEGLGKELKPSNTVIKSQMGSAISCKGSDPRSQIPDIDSSLAK